MSTLLPSQKTTHHHTNIIPSHITRIGKANYKIKILDKELY